MKTYSSVLKNNCFTAQTRKTIEAAVKSVSEQEDRSKNGLIYEMEETSGEVLLDRVEKVLEEIDEKPVVKDCVRVGMKRSGDSNLRPVKFSLSNTDHVAQVLINAKKTSHKRGVQFS